MFILAEVKTALRITGEAFDLEIQDLISASKQDLVLAGVAQNKAENDRDPLIKRAIITYCKTHFGFDNPDAERLQRSYDMLKQHLSMAGDYADPGVS